MKREIRNVVFALAGVCVAAGILVSAAGFMKGGSMRRALQNTGFLPRFKINSDVRGTVPYGNGGDYDDDMEDIYEFFREFGLDDDDIDDFLNPYGGSMPDSRSSGGGKIY